MNILIVSLSPIEAITSAMIRNLALVRGLEESGNHVDFLAVPFNVLLSQAKENEFVKKINVIRTESSSAYDRVVTDRKRKSTFKTFVRNVLRKVWHTFSVYDYTYMIAKSVSISVLPQTHYDMVISSSDPKSSHIAVKTLRKQGLTYDRWIQYWGDPLAIDITKKSIYPRFMLKYIEKKLISGADKIVYVSPFTQKEQQRLFPAYEDKMEFLPIAYMEEEIFPETLNERFVIGYYGNYSSNVRNLRPFYDACTELKEKVDVSIYGDSDMELASTEHVHIFPRGIIDEHKQIADLLVCVLNSYGTQIPGKIYHLAGTNKKVLVVLDGEYREEMADYLEKFDRFYMCNNEKQSIREKIEEIMKDNRQFEPLRRLRYDSIAQELIK